MRNMDACCIVDNVFNTTLFMVLMVPAETISNMFTAVAISYVA